MFASFLSGDVAGPDLVDDDGVVGLRLRQREPEKADPDQDGAAHVDNRSQTLERKFVVSLGSSFIDVVNKF